MHQRFRARLPPGLLLTRPLRAVEGKTLLHLAAESGCNLAVVQRVASEFPESAEHQDVNGRFAVQLSIGIAMAVCTLFGRLFSRSFFALFCPFSKAVPGQLVDCVRHTRDAHPTKGLSQRRLPELGQCCDYIESLCVFCICPVA